MCLSTMVFDFLIGEAWPVVAGCLHQCLHAKLQRGQTSLPDPSFYLWWRFRDSNPGPADYDSVALTD